MRLESTKLQRGDVVVLAGSNWPAVVWGVTRGKLMREFATVLVDVFGLEHEAGSVYVQDLVGTPAGIAVYDVQNPDDSQDRDLIMQLLQRQSHAFTELLASITTTTARR